MNSSSIKEKWVIFWVVPKNRMKLMLSLFVLVTILSQFPIFFDYIEHRNGVVLNDWLLNNIPALDSSVLIFIVIWTVSIYVLFRLIKHPERFLLLIIGYTLLCLTRMITMYLFPLNPPNHLIPLIDPITSIFYGGTDRFITKDLFFSGHTSTQFLLFLCVPSPRDKKIAFISSITIGILVLLQHVHYTIDVIAAFGFTYLIFRLANWLKSI